MNGNTLRTGKCLHCGKTKETHYSILLYCDKTSLAVNVTTFKDSGLAALDAHKEELYEAVKEFIDKLNSSGIGVFTTVRAKFESILNQIEKEI